MAYYWRQRQQWLPTLTPARFDYDKPEIRLMPLGRQPAAPFLLPSAVALLWQQILAAEGDEWGLV